MRVIPGDTMPAIDARLAGGGRWALAREKADKLALLAFYRGIFCPVCRTWLGELDRLLPEFYQRGVSVIALSCDKKDAAERAVKEWGLQRLRVGFNLAPDDARQAASRYRGRGSPAMPGATPNCEGTGSWRASERQKASMVSMRRR